MAPPSLFRLAHGFDARVRAAVRTTRSALGWSRATRILPYRGFGLASAAQVKGRVLEDRPQAVPGDNKGLLGASLASWRRYNTAELPGVRVHARWGKASAEGVTDDEGFFDLSITPPKGAAPGWHDVEVTGPDDGASAHAPVLLVGGRAEHGVITDVDDTVIVTGVTNLAKRAWALFLTEAGSRMPFDGAADLYSVLADGASGRADNPIFYVSSCPWNLFDHLDDFLERHGFPAGPILLRDWGLTRDGFAPDGRHGHKIAKMAAILDALPDLPFILVGDSGQRDPENYLQLVERYGKRIACVYIRVVPSRAGRMDAIRALAKRVREAGSELLLAEHSQTILQHAMSRGFIRRRSGPTEASVG